MFVLLTMAAFRTAILRYVSGTMFPYFDGTKLRTLPNEIPPYLEETIKIKFSSQKRS